MKNATFSLNLYNDEGDQYSEGVFIHIDNNIILRFENIEEVEDFTKQLTKITTEIRRDWM
jgi:peptide methionine sulfoxide reductase MsrA